MAPLIEENMFFSPFIFPNFLTQANIHWLEGNCPITGHTKKFIFPLSLRKHPEHVNST